MRHLKKNHLPMMTSAYSTLWLVRSVTWALRASRAQSDVVTCVSASTMLLTLSTPLSSVSSVSQRILRPSEADGAPAGADFDAVRLARRLRTSDADVVADESLSLLSSRCIFNRFGQSSQHFGQWTSPHFNRLHSPFHVPVRRKIKNWLNFTPISTHFISIESS